MTYSNYNRDGIHKNTYQLLFKEKETNLQDCSKEIFTIEMSSFHSRQLKDIPALWIVKLVEMYFYKINYFHIHKHLLKSGYSYLDKNSQFTFFYLEKYLRKILKKENPYVKRELLFNMKYNLRDSDCFSTNLILSANIENSFFVTSLLEVEDGTTHLHSYVVYKDYVIDYTKNLIIKKDIYDKLLKVHELQRMKSQDIVPLFNLLLENKILNTTLILATFGTEIKADLEKNKQLLKTPTTQESRFSTLIPE